MHFNGIGYLQLQLSAEKLYQINNPFGVFTATRIIQGAQDTVKYFQAAMEEALDIHQRGDLLL